MWSRSKRQRRYVRVSRHSVAVCLNQLPVPFTLGCRRMGSDPSRATCGPSSTATAGASTSVCPSPSKHVVVVLIPSSLPESTLSLRMQRPNLTYYQLILTMHEQIQSWKVQPVPDQDVRKRSQVTDPRLDAAKLAKLRSRASPRRPLASTSSRWHRRGSKMRYEVANAYRSVICTVLRLSSCKTIAALKITGNHA
jgi:hypothetical protein